MPDLRGMMVNTQGEVNNPIPVRVFSVVRLGTRFLSGTEIKEVGGGRQTQGVMVDLWIEIDETMYWSAETHECATAVIVCPP